MISYQQTGAKTQALVGKVIFYLIKKIERKLLT
jgi:hypothetical protein